MDWLKLKRKILQQPSQIDKKGDTYKEIILDETCDLTPSGRHRVFGRRSRNPPAPGSYRHYTKVQNLHETQKPEFRKDAHWFSNLVAEAEEYGLYVKQSDDKERVSIVVGMKVKDRDE